MKYFAGFCAMVALLAASPTLAADLAAPAPAAPVAAAPAPLSWTGPYLGAQAGYVWGTGPSPDETWTPNAAGMSLGAFAGYNYDLGGAVIGAEVGANWDGATGSVVTGFPGETFKLDQNWDASLVGRVGIPVADSFLLYGLVGGSVTQLTGTFVETGAPNSASTSATVWGYTVGLGAEYKLSDMIGVRGEYRFSSYGNANLTCPTCGTTTANYSSNAATIGLLAHW